MPVAHFSSVEPFIHRDYAALVSAVPVVALGSIATFVLRDRAAAAKTPAVAEYGPARELVLAGVVLALMADRLESDPLGYPQLAGAAARLVADQPAQSPIRRAQLAAVNVLRPLALSTLIRAAVWDLA